MLRQSEFILEIMETCRKVEKVEGLDSEQWIKNNFFNWKNIRVKRVIRRDSTERKVGT